MKTMIRNSGMILYICAGFLLSGGIILGGSTAWSLIRMSHYFWLTDFGVELGSGILFVSGSILCLPACWVATLAPQHPRSISVVGSLMCLVSVAMLLLATGLTTSAGMVRALRDPSVVNTSMHRAMAQESFDRAIRNSFASLQIELKCCGINNYADWFNYGGKLPIACCGREWNSKRADLCLRPIYNYGCLRLVVTELRTYTHTVTILAYTIVFILAITLLAATCTWVSSVVEYGDLRAKQYPPLRIACLTSNSLFSPQAHTLLSQRPMNSSPVGDVHPRMERFN